jgi:hypothetical protein
MKKNSLLIFIISLLVSVLGVSAQTNIILKPNKKFVKKGIFKPKSNTDAIIYRFRGKKGQTINIKTMSNEIDLGAEYPCSVGFWLYDDADEYALAGDYPAAPSEYEGKLPKTGFYKLKVYVDSPEGCSDKIIKQKKPRFDYNLEILLK